MCKCSLGFRCALKVCTWDFCIQSKPSFAIFCCFLALKFLALKSNSMYVRPIFTSLLSLQQLENIEVSQFHRTLSSFNTPTKPNSAFIMSLETEKSRVCTCHSQQSGQEILFQIRVLLYLHAISGIMSWGLGPLSQLETLQMNLSSKIFLYSDEYCSCKNTVSRVAP